MPLAYRQSSDLRETPAPLIRFLRRCTTFGFHCMFAVALQRCISIGTNSFGELFGWNCIYRSTLKVLRLQASVCVGSKSELSNYRPISLLTSFSKIFEKVIYKRLDNHASVYNILSKVQYGFRTNLSTENAIYQLTNNILKALDNKQLVGGIFCDLSKAFDCVDHETLLNRLEYYGVKRNS